MEELTTMLERAKTDRETRNKIIDKYTPFVLKTTSEFLNRYVDACADEEYSVGLLAFNEAIDSFDRDRGASFFTFARTVIRRRLIDYYRKNSNRAGEVSINVLEDENSSIEYDISMERFRQRNEQEERVNEIREYSRALYEFGISFDSLVEVSPRKKDARERAMEIARLIAGNPKLTGYLVHNKLLPLKEIEHMTTLSRKTLERNRKYIIAIVLIMIGDYSYLKSYVQGIEG